MLQINQKELTLLVRESSVTTKIILTGRALVEYSSKFSQQNVDSTSCFSVVTQYSVGIPLMAEPRRCRECAMLMDIYCHHALVSGGFDKHDSIKMEFLD